MLDRLDAVQDAERMLARQIQSAAAAAAALQRLGPAAQQRVQKLEGVIAADQAQLPALQQQDDALSQQVAALG